MYEKPLRKSIGRDAAIEMYESGWWEGLPARTVAVTQFLIDELCMPFDKFHAAVEEALGRGVFTHEFGLNYDGLLEELLGGGKAPTMAEVLAMLPADKTAILVTS